MSDKSEENESDLDEINNDLSKTTEESSLSAKNIISSNNSEMVTEQAKVLQPDNPLLERFQKALKEQLLRQIEHLKSDIFGYETETKKNNNKRNELGVQTYEIQQMVNKQQNDLNNCFKQLETVRGAREEIENVLDEKKAVHKAETKKLLQLERKEMEIRNEIEATTLLINQLTDYETNLESELTTNQLIAGKTQKDRIKLAMDKRQQDMLIYKLTTIIWKLENEIETMDMQLKVKEIEREELAETVALGNTNIEALKTEYRCLMHSWNSVVVAIENRDKILSCFENELKKLDEEFKTIKTEIQQVKKLGGKEMERNEELTMIKNRILNDIQTCKTQMNEEINKKQFIEREMNESQLIIEQIEKDISKAEEECNEKSKFLTSLVRKSDKLALNKIKLEEEILIKLEDQLTNDKSTINLTKLIRQIKLNNREMEIQLAESNNKNAKIQSQIELQRFTNNEINKFINELSQQIAELEDKSKELNNYLQRISTLLTKHQRELDFYNLRYNKLIEQLGPAASSPFEYKINILESNLIDLKENNKKTQIYWLKEQRNLVNLSQQRQEQINTISLLSKQILIVEQKNLKITDELETHNKNEEKIRRNLNGLESRLKTLTNTLLEKVGHKDSLDKNNELIKDEYASKLKDAEMDCVKLESEIVEIENEKLMLSKELYELNREALEWEKKLILIKETKNKINNERSEYGEVGTMKAEIHRMNVRYSQLQKAQEKLINDLEFCVARRDSIITTSEAREKRIKGGIDKTRFNFTRKLDDLRNKIKQTENEIANLEKEIQQMIQIKKNLIKKINESQEELTNVEKYISDLLKDFEESKTNRQLNAELLLLIQKKFNLYVDLSKKRTPFTVYRTESALTDEYNKQKILNSKLIQIAENLINDFPNYYHELNRILNSLKLPVFVVYG